ncbi:uncharacterized protein MEPE_01359 [Melanopsichium pennsylvanicum]|uniref:Uncharacterized protein n=1 Tax=Melanopsichium pennsylvanicum TaxID=63383 RepID=A0AAJ4XIB8_9BASI|nr:uncharacterized protein MEPE_01359 [Melanopsichium pennsylvanicum]
MNLEQDRDGWIGGSSQSIYARKSAPATHASPPPAAKSANKPSPVTPGRDKSQSTDCKSRSLLERMEMAQNLHTPPSKGRNGQVDTNYSAGASSTPSPSSNPTTSPFRTTPSQGIRRPGAKIPSPLPLTSPARNNGPASPLNTRTPLSASHPIPETPLKLSQRGGPQTPATPHYPAYSHSSQTHNQDGDAARASGLGLGLTPLKTPIPLAPSPDAMRSPLNDPLHLRGRAASNASIGSPLKSGRGDLHGEPLTLGSSSSGSKGGNGQIDAMLDRLRKTRSGLGTGASMWAPKPTSDNSSSSASTTSHAIGNGFSSSNLLGVQTGLDRKRPSHRPNGLQLSLGQEISVMQELEEKAEEDCPPSTISSANVGETFRIDPPDNQPENGDADGWHGTIVPPTPSLGCDSPSSDEDTGATKAPSRSLDAFGWGSHGNSEPRKSSLFSKLPTSSTLEANWSGDDDDVRKNDEEIFEDMQSRAKASSKEKRNHAITNNGSNSNSNFEPLPPPPINYAKSRTPSPTTHRMLAKSPRLDGDEGAAGRGFDELMFVSSNVATSPSKTEAGLKASTKHLSPVSTRSQQLHSDDSDGDDADVETERSAQQRKARKKLEPKSSPVDEDKTQHRQVEGRSGLEKKRSFKRDKSERIRGRRASQSKEKDVDRVKMSAQAPATATVSLPSFTFANKEIGTEELASAVEKVKLDRDSAASRNGDAGNLSQTSPDTKATVAPKAAETPVAQRVQTIPAMKDDLFSSPAVPKVELPDAGVSVVESTTVENASKEDNSTRTPLVEKEKAAEPSHAKTMSFDWAADDDELDDELPDLDDWGVTLTRAKPTPVEPCKETNKPLQNGKSIKAEDGPWRRGGMLDAVGNKSKSSKRSLLEGKDRSSSPVFSSSVKDKAVNGGGGVEFGIRIAGRASLSPETETKSAPPSTPYGRWKNPSQPQAQQEEFSIKGAARSAETTSTLTTAKKDEGSKIRPRIAADVGASAKLLSPADDAPAGPGGLKHTAVCGDASSRSRKGSPSVDKGGNEWTIAGKKKTPRTTNTAMGKSGAGESMHTLSPSVNDSVHAPKNRTSVNPTPTAGAGVGFAGSASSVSCSSRGSGKRGSRVGKKVT